MTMRMNEDDCRYDYHPRIDKVMLERRTIKMKDAQDQKQKLVHRMVRKSDYFDSRLISDKDE